MLALALTNAPGISTVKSARAAAAPNGNNGPVELGELVVVF